MTANIMKQRSPAVLSLICMLPVVAGHLGRQMVQIAFTYLLRVFSRGKQRKRVF